MYTLACFVISSPTPLCWTSACARWVRTNRTRWRKRVASVYWTSHRPTPARSSDTSSRTVHGSITLAAPTSGSTVSTVLYPPSKYQNYCSAFLGRAVECSAAAMSHPVVVVVLVVGCCKWGNENVSCLFGSKTLFVRNLVKSSVP